MATTQSLARRRTLRRFLTSRKLRRTAAFYAFIGPWLLGLLRGGAEITGLTLTRFYGIHMLVLPVLTFVFLGVHFVIIRRQGISGPL